MKMILTKQYVGDMVALYLCETNNDRVGLCIVPKEQENEVNLDGNWSIEPMVQVHLSGEASPGGFSHGRSMRNSISANNLTFREQYKTVEKDGSITCNTILESQKLEVVHRLTFKENGVGAFVETEVKNIFIKDITIEMLSSFSLCGFPSFGEGERAEDLNFYRMMSKWSAEGRLKKESFVNLQLEPSWQKYGVQSIRFGQNGSMPVRGYFPWAIVEDTSYQVSLGAMIYYAGSWQMELYNKDERYGLSGGLADFEQGHWRKTLKYGESITTPKAVITVVKGGVDDVSNRFTKMMEKQEEYIPSSEKELSITYNEYCTTWGMPSEERIKNILPHLKNKGIKYFVIDAGWYAKTVGNWQGNMGDWIINKNLFPNQFTNVVKLIRENGMIPGLWFEPEVVGELSKVFYKEDLLLKRDGAPITAGTRRFWDLRNEEVKQYLKEHVIDLLKEYGFGYVKLDYNDNIGIGCDGAESYGEGLRQQLSAVKEFYQFIRQEIPDIVIETCASGGHRLEPSMLELSDMASFSDAHENVSIPILAANVQRAIRADQSQIWAVLHKEDSIQKLVYSLTSTFLGRMCLSGEIEKLDELQWNWIEKGIRFYKEVDPIIQHGRSYRYGKEDLSYSNPKGWQAMIRMAEDGKRGIAVIHTFQDIPDKIELSLPIQEKEDYQVVSYYGLDGTKILIENQILKVTDLKEWEGMVVLFQL